MKGNEQADSTRRILFIGPESYEYHRTLVQILGEKKIDVEFIGENNLDRIFRLARLLGEKTLTHYLKRWWESVENVARNGRFDQVLVIRGEMLRPYMMSRLHELQPNAEYIMYQWDSVRNHDYLQLVNYFDKVKTFDRVDSDTYGFTYFPLFYDHEFERLREVEVEPDIDLLMVGTLRSDRVEIAQSLQRQAQEVGLNVFFYIYIPFMTFAKKNLTGQKTGYDRSMVRFRSLPKREYLNLLMRTKVVLDINDKNQTGLTIRTLETLGAGKKLMTCNEHILKDIFYNSEWINVFDRQTPRLNMDFINLQPAEKINIEGLKMDRWLMSLLDD